MSTSVSVDGDKLDDRIRRLYHFCFVEWLLQSDEVSEETKERTRRIFLRANVDAVDSNVELDAPSSGEPSASTLAGLLRKDYTSTGRTPLHNASRWGHDEVAKTLLDAGWNVNAADNSGLTPLHYASRRGHAQMVKTLLDAGANVNAASNTVDNGGNTPLNSTNSNVEIDARSENEDSSVTSPGEPSASTLATSTSHMSTSVSVETSVEILLAALSQKIDLGNTRQVLQFAYALSPEVINPWYRYAESDAA
mmetsp:Transcript_20656/g.42128  ORF Transcript_20656/g.42128 Transcript_20656/m.42128 type:complete len:251 (-) Transcript_20656:2482-3234(-)